jgi:L-lactate utilization protein LutC
MTPDQIEGLQSRFQESGTNWTRINSREEFEQFLKLAKLAGPPHATVSEGEKAFTLADGIILETGTLILSGRRTGARRAAYLAESHFALTSEEAIYETLADFIAATKDNWREHAGPALTLITGPSRTADIEKTLVMGAHGPRELHVATAPERLIREFYAEDAQ